MSPTQFKSSEATVSLGQLGAVTALELSPEGGKKPTCTYIGGLPYGLPTGGVYRFRAPRRLPADYTYGTKSKPGVYTGKTTICPQPPYRFDPAPEDWGEDCLENNIWIPSGTPPEGGWPILFYIHGGWLQFGTANMGPSIVANLMHETPFRAIIVMPSYRLNLFGFLSSPELEAEARKNGETVGNMGFWDQRMSLEWVKKNAKAFSGNPSKITVAGYSAGSHSSFQQLQHDLDRPPAEQCISRVIMFSNGPGVKAKDIAESGKQFDELLGHLGISLNLSAEEKLKQLRAVDITTLVEVQKKMSISEFRALNDNAFINPHVHATINDGSFAKKCKARGIKIMNGECSEEWFLYASWRTPKDSYESIRERLIADYPEKTVNKLMKIYFPDKKLPSKYKDWIDAFGKVYADMQVYATERGFADRLDRNGFKAGTDLLRYRIEWRAECNQLPIEWGVTHSTDYDIWWWGAGEGDGLTEKEKPMAMPLVKVFSDFVGFKDIEWSEKGPKKQLTISADGVTAFKDDTLWEHGLKVWETATAEEIASPKL